MARDELIFSDYLRVILRHKIYIFLSVVLALALTHHFVGRKPAVYESRTRIKIQRLMTFVEMFDEVLVNSGNPIDNYVHEITSFVVASNAAANLLYPQSPTANDIARLQNAIRVDKVDRTDLLDVYSRGHAAENARQRGEAIIDSFIQHHAQALARNAEDVFQSIKASRDRLVEELKEKEQILWEDMGPRMLVGPGGTGELDALKSRLLQLRTNLDALRASGNYTEEYPSIRGMQQQQDALQEQINRVLHDEGMRQAQVADFEKQKAIVEEMSLFFTRKLEEARIATQKKSEIVLVIEPTNQGVSISQGKARLLFAGGLLGLLLGIVLTFVADSLDTSIRTLGEIEEAFGLSILGVIPHFSPDTVDMPLHHDTLWQRIRYSPFVSSASVFWRALRALYTSRRNRRTNSQSRQLIVPVSPRSPATEGYRILRTNIQLLIERGAGKVFLITSSGPAEGKSTTTANLAITFAQAGKKVLLVGANMRRPQMYRIFGLEREHGLSNILTGEISWKEALKDYRDVALGDESTSGLAKTPGMDHLFFITAGGRTIQPAEWLSMPVFHKLIEEMRQQFDVVLIDGTPMLPVPDSVIMSQVVDHVVVVYQVGVVSRESIRRAIKSLRNVGANVAGLVLNDIRSTWAEGADFQHYRGYYGKPETTG